MEKELISIVVPVYNCENKNISRCLNSIKDQTYKNFEVIIVDDCSTDNTVSLVKEQIKGDPRFTLHSLKTNGGVSNARNYGLDKVQGDYVSFIDSDDFIHKDFLRIMLHIALQNNAQLVSCSQHICYSDHLKSKYEIYPKEKKEQNITLNSHFDYLQSYARHFCWGAIYSKDIVKKLRFDKTLAVGEDALFWAESLINAGSVFYTNAELYYYIIYPSSMIYDEFTYKKYTDILAWQKIIETFKTRCPQIWKGTLRYSLTAFLCQRCITNYKFDTTGKYRVRMYDIVKSNLPLIRSSTLPQKQKLAILLFVKSPKTFIFFESVKDGSKGFIKLLLGKKI